MRDEEKKPLCDNYDCSHCGRFDCIRHPEHEEDDLPAEAYDKRRPARMDTSRFPWKREN